MIILTVVGLIDSELLPSEKLADFLKSTHKVAFSQWSDIFSGTFLRDLLLLYSDMRQKV